MTDNIHILLRKFTRAFIICHLKNMKENTIMNIILCFLFSGLFSHVFFLKSGWIIWNDILTGKFDFHLNGHSAQPVVSSEELLFKRQCSSALLTAPQFNKLIKALYKFFLVFFKSHEPGKTHSSYQNFKIVLINRM